MGIIDEVDHSKKEVTVDRKETRKLEDKELDARDLMIRACHAMRAPFITPLGAAGVFFYKNTLSGGYEYKIIPSIEQVPEGLGKSAVVEFTRAMMKAYGHKVPGEETSSEPQ